MLEPRRNLSEQIRDLIRERILDGRLPAGLRINEVHLAGELAVSRTPVREALMGLVVEGALRSEPGKGVFVRPLTAEEFSHIYPIRGLLDPEALRLAGLPSRARIERLRELNEELRSERDPAARVTLDDAWHLELIASCPNPILLELIRQFMARTRRYELAYYRDEYNLEISTGDHARVHEAAEGGDLDAVVEALRSNLTSGTEPILAWLERQGTGSAGEREEGDE